MRRMKSKSLVVAALVALAAAAAPELRAAEPQPPPAPEPAAMTALLQAAPGTYAVTGRKLAAADKNSAIPVFVQADALRPAEGTGVRVPLAIGVGASAPWVLQMRVTGAGGASVADPAGDIVVSGQAGVSREIREITLAPGEYELAIAVAAQSGTGQWNATTVRQPMSVPNLSDGLAASPVVLGEKAAAASQSDAGRPFVFGPTTLTPAALNRFRQSDRIHVALRINGWKGDTASKPDLTVEYVFQQALSNEFRFFNKTKPQDLNATTLAKTFDGQSGILATGMTVPLAAFPPGQFQLVVRVKDKRTQATTVQKATFVVQG